MPHDVSKARYRVHLTHNPVDSSGIDWTAEVYDYGRDDSAVHVAYGSTRDRAFDNAHIWIKKSLRPPESASVVTLDGAGEIIDRHDL